MAAPMLGANVDKEQMAALTGFHILPFYSSFTLMLPIARMPWLTKIDLYVNACLGGKKQKKQQKKKQKHLLAGAVSFHRVIIQAMSIEQLGQVNNWKKKYTFHFLNNVRSLLMSYCVKAQVWLGKNTGFLLHSDMEKVVLQSRLCLFLQSCSALLTVGELTVCDLGRWSEMLLDEKRTHQV